MKQTIKQNLFKESLVVMIFLVLSIVLLALFPEKIGPVTSTAGSYLLEMIYILPAVMILMGLFAVFIPDKAVAAYLGKASGVKGMLIAIFLGALPTGPLYAAFPIAAVWLKKGASVSNMVAFLSAWACIKLPQEIVEFQFLGIKFMLLRLILTILSVILMGLMIESIISFHSEKGRHRGTEG